MTASEIPAETSCKLSLTLKNEHGLHARPAARFVQTAASFDADIRVRNERSGKGPVQAKSLNSLATLGAVGGDRITILASGRAGQKGAGCADRPGGKQLWRAGSAPPAPAPSAQPATS